MTGPGPRSKEFDPQGIILSGSPASVYDAQAPLPDPRIFELGIPVLGICYGMQLLTHQLGGRVEHSHKREYGRVELNIRDFEGLFQGLDRGGRKSQTVWMSHGDRIEKLPSGFAAIAGSGNVRLRPCGIGLGRCGGSSSIRKWSIPPTATGC